MRLLGSLILAVCGCFVFADVTKLKDDSFESFVKSGPSFVYFQKGSSDAHTKQWASFQEAQPKLADTKVQIAFVDCEWKKAKKTCQKFELAKFPTVPTHPTHPITHARRRRRRPPPTHSRTARHGTARHGTHARTHRHACTSTQHVLTRAQRTYTQAHARTPPPTRSALAPFATAGSGVGANGHAPALANGATLLYLGCTASLIREP